MSVNELPVPNYAHSKISLKEAKQKVYEFQTRNSIQTALNDQISQVCSSATESNNKIGFRASRKSEKQDENNPIRGWSTN